MITALPTRCVPRLANVPMQCGPVSVSAVSTMMFSYGRPERLRRALRRDRLDALAEVDRGQRDHEGPRGRGVDQRLGRVAAQVHAGRVVDGGVAAAAEPGHRIRPSRGVVDDQGARLGAQLVADQLGRALHDLDERGALRDLAVRLHVAVAVGVAEAQLERVELQRPRDPVHLALQGVVGDRHAEAAHRARRRAVGVDAVASTYTFGDRVRPRHVRGRLRRPVGRVARVGAGVDVERDLAGDDPAVGHHAVLDVDALGGARRGDLHLLLAAVDELHRLVRQPSPRGRRSARPSRRPCRRSRRRPCRPAPELAERHLEDQRRVVQREEARPACRSGSAAGRRPAG